MAPAARAVKPLANRATASLHASFPFQYVSIHAAYLYDSVKLYARALDQLLRDQPNQTLMEVAGNGTRIIETIIKNHTYQSKYV